ncbi:MAG: hypothetical protein Q9225_002474 [Loekoesia sp. 1 TL-2023]
MDARHVASGNAFQSAARDSGPRPRTSHQHHTPAPQRHAATYIRFNGPPAWPTEPLKPGIRVPPEIRNEAQKHHGSVVFHWNPIPSGKFQMPLSDAVAWFEASGKQFIAFNKVTGQVKGYLAPTAIVNHLRGKEVEGKARTEPKRTQSRPSKEYYDRTLVAASQAAVKVGAKEKPPVPRFQANKASSRGYNPKAPPFDFFTSKGIGPLDEDPDIVWILERGLYRAYHLSTLEHDPMATPNLVKETTAKHVIHEAKEWLKLLKRRVTGDLKTQWDDQLPAARSTARTIQKPQPRNPVSAPVAPKAHVAAPQVMNVTARHNDGGRQSTKPAAYPLQRFHLKREQQQRATPGAGLAARTVQASPAADADMTLDKYEYPVDSTQTKKRKSEERETDTTEYKKSRLSGEKQGIPHQSGFHQRSQNRHGNYKAVQSTRPSPQTYLAEQSNFIAKSFAQPRPGSTASSPTQTQQAAPSSASLTAQPIPTAASSSNQIDLEHNGQAPLAAVADNHEQESFLALLGDDAYTNPADWA